MEEMQAQMLAEEERARGKRALVLVVFVAIVSIMSILLALYKNDPRGVYIYAYEMTADGERESGKTIEYHLKSDGNAVYVSGAGVKMNGSWKKDGNKIILTFQGEKTVFHRSGNKLTEKLEDGGRVVYIKD